ncbi:hypothetical protein HN51_007793 [Arachis hypogaea]|uniref:Glycosyl transferase CAP10 domain-containing protein n=2 Tax=Arachis hypogaea TaxID=3818 RepID=A0A445D678_ARAHY|nr:O-glucosyltransferase rumi isoform X1 [Arachis hypogaea]QHO41999.1 O-glucosyltransferase rumi [Arachis hypogaea]RYR58735.1 hypothetical protein Ahy_A05g024619 isoform C [Arachis hypogaea]
MQRFTAQRHKRQLGGPITTATASTVWRPLLNKGPAYTSLLLLLLLILLTALFVSSFWSTASTGEPATVVANQNEIVVQSKMREKKTKKRWLRLNCSGTTENNHTCWRRRVEEEEEEEEGEGVEENSTVCPEYLRWIHEDLGPWKKKKIRKEMVEAANATAHFRIVVKKGRAYVLRYKKSIQTRDVFTIWGILQLMRRYPSMVPDLDLMFDCDDRPVIRARDYRRPNSIGPPPLFRYCGDRWTHDIVFPDWSFWGWAEINIRPWEQLLKEIKIGNEMIKWIDREPYAYWKGNPFVAEIRQDLLKCNVSDTQDWNARLFVQDWIKESQQGFNQSNLASQCTHRYKIYIEGYAWSVSEKNILACDSVTLMVKPRFYDFFIRSLQPTQHYWPIRDDDKCKSIKFAVHWGNNHKQKAQDIGKAASKFIQEELKMEYVYDYMFHLLNEYSKLLNYEPEVPEGAVEVCAEAMACTRSGLEKQFMIESMMNEPSTKAPCTLPPPFEPTSLRVFYGTKLNLIKRVERWEDNYWNNSTQTQQGNTITSQVIKSQ